MKNKKSYDKLTNAVGRLLARTYKRSKKGRRMVISICRTSRSLYRGNSIGLCLAAVLMLISMIYTITARSSPRSLAHAVYYAQQSRIVSYGACLYTYIVFLIRMITTIILDSANKSIYKE